MPRQILFTPPSFARPGDQFSVTDNVQNLGLNSAAASTTRYHLSKDTAKGAGDVLLVGTQAVPALGVQFPQNISGGTVIVTIPAGTALGSYHLLACAEDLNAVKESSDTNNCMASTSTVTLTRPDLRTSGVSSSASSVKRGHTIFVTDTVTNVANVGAGASTTRYYLSMDIAQGAGDILLTGTRPVGALVANGVSTDSVTVTVPASTSAGPYHLACADDLKVVK